jgi:hypothetical protein
MGVVVPYDVHEHTKPDFWRAEGDGPRPLHVHIHGSGWAPKASYWTSNAFLLPVKFNLP